MEEKSADNSTEESGKRNEVAGSIISSKLPFFEKLKQKTISFLKNKYNLAFLVVLLLAFLIRLKYIGQESIWNDGAVHLWYVIKVTKEPLFFFSSEFLVGDYFTIQTLTAIVYLFTKNIYLSGQVIAMLFGLTGIVFMYLLGKELKNEFVGLISATLLAFNHLFWFYNLRALADGPLVTMVIITFYCVVKLEKNPTLFWGISTAISFLALMLTKGQGALFFLVYLIYVLIFKRKEAVTQRFIFWSWIIPLGLIILGSIIKQQNFLHSLTIRFFERAGLQYPGLIALKVLPWVASWYILILALFGIILVLYYRKKEYYFPILSFLFYWLYFEIGVGTPLDRYMLPILPLLIILFVFALVEISSYLKLLTKSKYVSLILIVLFTIFISWQSYATGDQLILQKVNTYTGYIEAGEWLKENVPENTPIFAGSPRTMRAMVGRAYAGPGEFSQGGSIWFLRAEEYTNNQSFFEADLSSLSQSSDVYLEVDIWEYTQPSWYFPLSQESFTYFIGLGFQPVKIIEREVQTQEGLKKMPVVFILKKDKISILK